MFGRKIGPSGQQGPVVEAHIRTMVNPALGKIDTSNTQIHNPSVSWLGIGKSNIKIVEKEAKLILLEHIYMNAQFPVLSRTLQ